MRLSKTGLALIMRFEGFSAKPYLCPARVWTQGFGHTKGVAPSSSFIDQQKAQEWLLEDVMDAEGAVGRLIRRKLSQGQFDALVSFTFNLGAGRLQSSTLRRKVNGGYDSEVPRQLLRWCKGDGKVMPGLLARRKAEAAMYQN